MSNPQSPPHRTAVIATALGLEFLAVQRMLINCRELIHRSGTVYQVGTLLGEQAIWTVAVVECGAGNAVAGIETSRAIDYFDPDVVLFVGVGGGMKDVAIGDVVAADCVYGYEASKVAETVFPRIKTYACGYPLTQRARAVIREESWKKRVTTGREPRGFIGPIASGERVLAHHDAEAVRLLKERCGDALAVEMEGFGFLVGAHCSEDVPSMVIRGISDLLRDKDPELDRVNQPDAAQHAAAFAAELLATFGPTRRRRRQPARSR